MNYATYLKNYPNSEGKFGNFGGAYLPPHLVPAMEEINDAYLTICQSSQFINELRRIRRSRSPDSCLSLRKTQPPEWQ